MQSCIKISSYFESFGRVRVLKLGMHRYRTSGLIQTADNKVLLYLKLYIIHIQYMNTSERMKEITLVNFTLNMNC